MSQSATLTTGCVCPAPVSLTARFDGPQLTSDGGRIWLAEVDASLGLSTRLADAIPEWRTGFVQHSRLELLRQRLSQIACGYEDQDDADTLRTDPLFKLACGRLPEDAPLASQPTHSRFENAIDAPTTRRLADALLSLYLDERGRAGRPARILIDADSTDDPTYGDQEGSACHGYYQQHMYHPLLLWDGGTDQPIAAVLRPGTCHASRASHCDTSTPLARNVNEVFRPGCFLRSWVLSPKVIPSEKVAQQLDFIKDAVLCADVIQQIPGLRLL